MPTLNVAAKVGQTFSNLTYNGTDFRFKFWDHKEEIFISNMRWTKFDLNIGARNEYYGVQDWLMTSNEGVDPGSISRVSGDFVSAFVSSRTNTFDNGYFPRRGVNMGFDYKWVFAKPGDQDFHPVHIASFDYRQVIRMGGRVALIYGVNARALLQNRDAGYMSDFPLRNCIGGFMAGRYLDQQMPFIGFRDMLITEDYLATADLALRLRFGKNLFTTVQGAYFRSAATPGDFIRLEDGVGLNAIGAALELGYHTIAGPLRLNVHWSDMTRKVGVYMSFGYDF